MFRTLLPALFCIAFIGLNDTLHAQTIALPEAEYDRLKLAGMLPEGAFPLLTTPTPDQVKGMPMGGGSPKGGGGSNCDCWIPPDGTYTLAMAPNDDGSSAPIFLPFQFNLYGDLFNLVYINNNGNLSFNTPWATFTASGFPSANFRMVAPFWGDVDTRGNAGAGNNQVRYKLTPTALYVNWINVGYYNSKVDKLNSFQVIITNGQDPVIGIGNNVSFCYKDMQWTTGEASCTTNTLCNYQGQNYSCNNTGGNGFGFCGSPATVGANRGNGVDYIQFGRFNLPGTAYDGPFGANDGVDWLDDKNFVFTTAVSTQNIPPIASSAFLCDTIEVCVGEVVTIQMDFLSPENNQVTVATSSAPGLANYTETSNTSGITATIVAQFSPQPGEEGYQTITFSGTDNGVPPLTSTVEIVVYVIPGPPPPTITGPTFVCQGQTVQLTASPAGSNYTWSNGASGQTVNVGAGTYTVTATDGSCPVTSAPFMVQTVDFPPLEITGPAIYCGEPLPTLVASAGYDGYTWSTGASGSSLQTGAGTYTVTGTIQGCTNTSAPFTLTLVDPGPPTITGPAEYCAGSSVTLNVNATPYDGILWSTGESTASISATAGTYTVTATFLNCTYQSAPFTVTEIVLPTVTITGDAQYCAGSASTLTASGGFDSWSWSNGASGPSTSVQAGTYTVTVSIGDCSATSAPFTVTEAPTPVPVITGPNFTCGGGTVSLSTTQPFDSYLWSTGASSSSVNVGTGSYTVTVTNQFGCSGTSAAFGVTVANDPTAFFTPDPLSPQLPGTTVFFQDGSQGNGGTINNWWWEFGTGGSTSTIPSPTVTFDEPGAYTITLVVTTTQGCTDTITYVYVIRPEEIFIPNVFSPNNDGMNDAFNITNIQYYPNNLTIFNRWGSVVYEARNYTNQWRGTDLADGTYFYILKLDEGREFTGHVTLLR
ncbi:MAG: gliding motility-associated C-terminal domain-containing protein [Flavobacteriales bacterium]|nr:gliding motility-associated C-terminal domain-containing protein [Flavobacteriales bacterium]